MRPSALPRAFAGFARRMHAFAALCALALLPGCARSQEAEGAWSEAVRIENRLEEIEARALRDPELRRMDEALGEALMAAMVDVDPGLPAAAGRLPLLRERHARAVQSGAEEEARDLRRRIADIEARYLQAQSDALREPSLSERAARFNALLRARMLETDAAAGELLRRYAELRGLVDR